MALVTIPQIPLGFVPASAIATSLFLLDGATEWCAQLFQIPKSGDITGVTYRLSGASGTRTLSIGLETVSAGAPTGTGYKGCVAATRSTLAANTTYTETFSTAATSAVQGDIVALVFKFSAYTSGNVTIRSMFAGLGSISGSTGFPNVVYDIGAGTVHENTGRNLQCSIAYSDGSVISMPFCTPPVDSNITFGNGSTPDEYASLCNFPFKCRCVGMWGILDLDAQASFLLYDTDGTTVLGSAQIDQNFRGGTTIVPFNMLFEDSHILTPSGTYRYAKPPDTASTIILPTITLPTAADRASIPTLPMSGSSRTDGGEWTNSDTTFYFLGPIIDQLDDGVGGGGGGVRNPLGGPIG